VLAAGQLCVCGRLAIAAGVRAEQQRPRPPPQLVVDQAADRGKLAKL